MMKRILFNLFLATLILCSYNVNAQGQNKQKDEIVLKSLIGKYAESIEQAGDSSKASKLWARSKEVTFIHPRGHERQWIGIKNIYKMFDDTFSTKKLSCHSEHINVYGDVAWIEFYWTFDAIFKVDGKPLQTKGRETQIWRKINNDWKLVHVHYSGPPVTGAAQGF